MNSKRHKSTQLSFIGVVMAERGYQTARWRFFLEMERIIPWRELLAWIEPHYPKPGNGRPPYQLEPLVRLWLVREWFLLSNGEVIDAVYDSEAIRAFTGIDLWQQKPPSETTLERFQQILNKAGNGGPIFGDAFLAASRHGFAIVQGCIEEPCLKR